ncbi:MAG: ATP-binding protein [Phycisphaeraceae bacterium]|nr:ATP-binding protein [Phycisphaerae bacterium]MBX3391943.1 ATP-binding protein [Phycisphaeraceae bacterium]HRJ50750.1 ATP-binding protein [Phycisphaerales bacterium]
MTHDQQPMTESASLSVANDRVQIDRAIEQVAAALDRFGYDKASRFAVKLSLQEGLANAIFHGHKDLPPATPVRLEYSVSPSEVRLSISDQGPGFDPGSVPDPTLDENLERPCGRGIMLIRSYMTEVSYGPGGNRVDMRYARPSAATSP